MRLRRIGAVMLIVLLAPLAEHFALPRRWLRRLAEAMEGETPPGG